MDDQKMPPKPPDAKSKEKPSSLAPPGTPLSFEDAKQWARTAYAHTLRRLAD